MQIGTLLTQKMTENTRLPLPEQADATARGLLRCRDRPPPKNVSRLGYEPAWYLPEGRAEDQLPRGDTRHT